MIRLHKIITWDWKAQPDVAKITEAIAYIYQTGARPKLFQIETQEDSYGIVVTDADCPQEEAQVLYDHAD